LSALQANDAAQVIARSFCAGALVPERMVVHTLKQLSINRALLEILARATLKQFGTRLTSSHHLAIAKFIANQPSFANTFSLHSGQMLDEIAGLGDPSASPSAASVLPSRTSFIRTADNMRPACWPIPTHELVKVDSVDQLGLVLKVNPSQLDKWRRRWRQSADINHDQKHSDYYRYWQPKKKGGARLIEIPKPDLKQAQRHLLRKFIDRIEPHEAAHGFRKGHGILSHTHMHVGQPLVLKIDLQDFFPSIKRSRIHNIFRYLGYNEGVARVLTAIVTTRTCARITNQGREYNVQTNAMKAYQSDHLAQGSPTSPAIANLAAFNLDLRLSGLAQNAGVQYSRYADDFVFSGGFKSGVGSERFYQAICAIVLNEGFSVNFRKTRLMTQSKKQYVTGLVVNHGQNVARKEYDALKATLNNAKRYGLASQNLTGRPDFKFHLLGKIAFIAQTNVKRGAKLKTLWSSIES
jgi:RNA-directed DNA polymerase